MLMQYEQLVTEDHEQLRNAGNMPKSIVLVYEHLKRHPIANASFVAKSIGLSFNSVSKALHMLQEYGIIVQSGDSERNRIWHINRLTASLMQCDVINESGGIQL